MLQQDWIPSHGAKTTLALCHELFPNIRGERYLAFKFSRFESNGLLNLVNPGEKLCSTRHNSLKSLKDDLQKLWDEITEEELRPIIDNFPKSLDVCIKASGRHFKSSS